MSRKMWLWFVLICPIYALICPGGSSTNPVSYSYQSLINYNCTQFAFGSYVSIVISYISSSNLDALPRELTNINSPITCNIAKLYVTNNNNLVSMTNFPIYGANIREVIVTNNSALLDMGSINIFTGLTVSDNPLVANLVITNSVMTYLKLTNNPQLIFTCPNLVRVSDEVTLDNLGIVSTVNIFPKLSTMVGGSNPIMNIRNNTQLVSISGFVMFTQPYDSFILSITDNILLSDITLPFAQNINTLIIRNNGAYLDMPSLSQLKYVTLDNTNIQSLSNINAVNTGIIEIHITNNLHLISITGFQLVSVVLLMDIQNNAAFTTLNGFNSLTGLNNLVLINNANLRTFTALSHLILLPDSVESQGSCCPPYTFFDNTVWNLADFNHCKLCLSWIYASTFTLLDTGGITVDFDISGQITLNNIIMRFGSNNITCSYTSNKYSCITPTGSGIVQAEYLFNSIWFTTRLSFNYTSFSDYSRYSSDGNEMLVIGNTIYHDIEEIPGTPGSYAATILTITIWIPVVSFLVLMVFFGICLILQYYCKYNIPHYFKMIDVLFVPIVRVDSDEVVRRKNVPGGVVTVIMTVVGIALCLIYILNVLFNNVLISQGYIPSSSSRNTLSTYSLELEFIGYTGSCNIPFALTDMDTSHGNVTLITDASVGKCKWLWTCVNCMSSSDSAAISVIDNNANSAVRYINWKYTALDYFNKLSIVYGSISSSDNKFFKGNPVPTATIIINPSIYSYYQEDDRYGMLLRVKGQSLGNQLTTSNFALAKSAGFILYPVPYGSILRIAISSKQSNIVILSQFVAIISACIQAGKFMVTLASSYLTRKLKLPTRRGSAYEPTAISSPTSVKTESKEVEMTRV